jgi:hypothetical protein
LATLRVGAVGVVTLPDPLLPPDDVLDEELLPDVVPDVPLVGVVTVVPPVVAPDEEVLPDEEPEEPDDGPGPDGVPPVTLSSIGRNLFKSVWRALIVAAL